MPWLCLVLSEWQAHWPTSSIGAFLGQAHGPAMAWNWTFWLAIPWPKLFHGDAHCPCPCHGSLWCFLIGHHVGQALPLVLFWHHLWPCHGIAWCLLIGHPM